MLEMFRRAGIRNYSIWQTGDTLFGYYECDDLKTALAVQKNAPVSAHWRAYMRDVIRMERDPKSGAQPHLAQVFLFDGEIST
jgi:L-rhamnose mutarotase